VPSARRCAGAHGGASDAGAGPVTRRRAPPAARRAEHPSMTPAGIAPDAAGRPARLLLYGTVTLTGAAVMVLELLGTRILGPFFGVSLYVWSALIAVTLIALAAGYFLGGWCADRLPQLRLAHLLLAAALATLLVPLLSGPVLQVADLLGLRTGVLVSAAALFLAPLTLLGMTGPCVVKLLAEDLDGIGTTAGSVYAISTLGSVAGTLALGFVLLPWFGTRAILAGTGALLLVLGTTLAVHERRRLGGRHAIALVLIGAAGLVALGGGLWLPARTAAGFKVLSDVESPYGRVRVVDDEQRGIRMLLSDASSIGAVDRRSGETVLDYQRILTLVPALDERAPAAREGVQRALVIGLGPGFVATRYRALGIKTDTIEIDPAVAQAAQAHFGFRRTGKFLVGDGRHEIRMLAHRYDYIVHDCFSGGAEPAHLLTVETFERLRTLLKAEGVLALNFVGFTRGEGIAALAAVARTLDEVFPFQRIFATRPDDELSDYVLLAGPRPIRLAARDEIHRRHLAVLESLERSPPIEGGRLLTDDYHPIEHLQAGKAERYRALFRERLSPELLLP